MAKDSTGSGYNYGRGDRKKVFLKLPGAARLAGWPTSQSRDGHGGGQAKRTVGARRNLDDFVKLAGWPTATAADARKGKLLHQRPGKVGLGLATYAAFAGWATPAAREAGGTPERFLERKREAKENGSKLGVSLTSLNLQAQLAAFGEDAIGSLVKTVSGGQLNPAFSLWLMGYPAVWALFAARVTLSSRRSRRRSSKR
jgi:hypothetical protein